MIKSQTLDEVFNTVTKAKRRGWEGMMLALLPDRLVEI